jgi:hypothetical protein
MNYTIEDLEVKLKELNIDRLEFSNKDLIVLTRRIKEEVDKFFIEYENERLEMFSKMLGEFFMKGEEND